MMSKFNYQTLKETRRQYGYTQAQMADVIGVARTTYADYEKGRILPPIDKIQHICTMFGLQMSELIDVPPAPASGIYTEKQKIAERNVQLLDEIQKYIYDLTLEDNEGALLQSVLNILYGKYKGRCKR